MKSKKAKSRYKTEVTVADLDVLRDIYRLLNFNKDDFCKLVDAIGLEKWVSQVSRWCRLRDADEELTSKERYISAKCRLTELNDETRVLREYIENYQSNNAE